MSVNVPPYSNLQAAIVYDFGNTYINFRMLHYGKIYYFYYKIFDSMGNVAADGYIKHKFHDDTDDYNDITMFDPNWQLVTDDVPNLAPMYDVAVMYYVGQDEMCLTNNKGTAPLPSSVDVTDPVTGTVHTLEFTSDINGIYVYFD